MRKKTVWKLTEALIGGARDPSWNIFTFIPEENELTKMKKDKDKWNSDKLREFVSKDGKTESKMLKQKNKTKN